MQISSQAAIFVSAARDVLLQWENYASWLIRRVATTASRLRLRVSFRFVSSFSPYARCPVRILIGLASCGHGPVPLVDRTSRTTRRVEHVLIQPISGEAAVQSDVGRCRHAVSGAKSPELTSRVDVHWREPNSILSVPSQRPSLLDLGPHREEDPRRCEPSGTTCHTR